MTVVLGSAIGCLLVAAGMAVVNAVAPGGESLYLYERVLLAVLVCAALGLTIATLVLS